jgi:AraC-like DNA-binding protein
VAAAVRSADAGLVRPAERLRPLVASYIGFDMAGWPPGRHRGLPSGSLSLVISLGAPLVVRDAGGADISAAATIGGLRSSPVDIIHDGTQRGVQLELTPRGARALLGLPAAALAQGVWPLDDVAGSPRARELIESLAAAPGPAERVQVLDRVLARWAVDDRCPADGCPAAVDATWRLLTGSAGSVSVTDIAGQVGLGRRQLSQIVRAELGLTPKTVARILRFSQAGRYLRSGRTTSLAETAAVCGYYDQAHLTNDWRRLSGCTPGEWIAEELPFLQDQSPAPSRN